MNEMSKRHMAVGYPSQRGLSRVTLTGALGETEPLCSVSWLTAEVRGVAVELGVRNSVRQFCNTHCRVAGDAWGLPCWLSRTHSSINFVSLYLFPEMRGGFFFFLDNKPSGRGQGVTVSENLTYAHPDEDKWIRPLEACGIWTCVIWTHYPVSFRVLSPSQFSLRKVNTDAFSEHGHWQGWTQDSMKRSVLT